MADNAAVSPSAAAEACAEAMAEVFSRRRARGSGDSRIASVIRVARGEPGAKNNKGSQ